MARRKPLPPLSRYVHHRKKLYQGVLRLESEEECERFFVDLLTDQELYDVTKRFSIVELLLKEEETTIKKIEERVRTEFGESSTSTIVHAKKVLRGGCGGYALVFERMRVA